MRPGGPGGRRMVNILVTGGCGFIGSHFIRHLLAVQPDVQIVNLDALTYAGNPENVADCAADPRYTFIRADVAERSEVEPVVAEGRFDALVNFAAESHVDRSIVDARPVIRTNVVGAQVLLDLALRHRVGRMVQVSTDEVYGVVLRDETPATEKHRLRPNNPYAASKAAADLLARAYFRTYRLPVVVTRCCNNYGPNQFPEKLLALAITRALDDRPLPLYGDGLHRREWVHVSDHCRAIELVLRKGTPGEVYNVGGVNEHANIEMLERVLDILGKPRSLIQHVEDRRGHDRRYAIDATKTREALGWASEVPFEDGLRATVEWYRQHHAWWETATKKTGG